MMQRESQIEGPARPVAAVVVAPTFNNAVTLANVLDRILQLGLPIIAVNDGSTDDTAAVLARCAASSPSVTVCTHAANRGKASALRTGFDKARTLGYTHAVTIDTDGQLSPEDIPALLQAAAKQPQALVIGTRDESAAGYPNRSRLGRRASNLLVRWESGVHVEDSQCGLRVYPLHFVQRAQCRADFYGYETEIITRAGWAEVPVVGVSVSCTYLPAGERVSHFKPWRDSLRSVAMHFRLMSISLLARPARIRERRTLIDAPTDVRPVESLGG
jgi:glycosyltransferase involved in cell wall biosynthesis